MDNTEKPLTLQEIIAKFLKFSWPHEYAENGIVSCHDATHIALMYASQQTEQLQAEMQAWKNQCEVTEGLWQAADEGYHKSQDKIKSLTEASATLQKKNDELEGRLTGLCQRQNEKVKEWMEASAADKEEIKRLRSQIIPATKQAFEDKAEIRALKEASAEKDREIEHFSLMAAKWDEEGKEKDKRIQELESGLDKIREWAKAGGFILVSTNK
jgi:chromosome segregation ATPase